MLFYQNLIAKIICFLRLVVAIFILMILALCNKDSKVFGMLNKMGLVQPPYRCPIPVANDPNKVVIPAICSGG